MRDFLETLWIVVLGAIISIGGLVIGGAGIVLMIALPFVAIGAGLGSAGWVFCLFVGFC